MKPTVIPHPLKRIHFKYHSEAALSDFEKAFIDRYRQLHDELASIKNQLLYLAPDIIRVDSELTVVSSAFEKLRTLILRTERMFGMGPADETVPGVYSIKSGEIQSALDEFQAVRSGYWDLMVPMHKKFNSVYEQFAAFDDKVEHFEKVFSAPLFRNQAHMEIDTLCFDNDMNQFRVEWVGVAHLQDECLDDFSEWAKKQTALVSNSDALFVRIKKLFHYIDTIQKLGDGNKENEFGLN